MKPRDAQTQPQRRARSVAVRMLPTRDQCRCSCGSLLARLVREGLELKCRKCKRLVVITHDELVGMYQKLDLTPPFMPSLRELRPR